MFAQNINFTNHYQDRPTPPFQIKKKTEKNIVAGHLSCILPKIRENNECLIIISQSHPLTLSLIYHHQAKKKIKKIHQSERSNIFSYRNRNRISFYILKILLQVSIIQTSINRNMCDKS